MQGAVYHKSVVSDAPPFFIPCRNAALREEVKVKWKAVCWLGWLLPCFTLHLAYLTSASYAVVCLMSCSCLVCTCFLSNNTLWPTVNFNLSSSMQSSNDRLPLFNAGAGWIEGVCVVLFFSSLKCKLKAAITAHRRWNPEKSYDGNKKGQQLR